MLTLETSIEDFELIERVRAGQRDDYAHLVRKYQARVLRLCTSLLSDPVLAEDAAQDIFLNAYQGLAAFRGASLFSTWLYRIAANHCRDLLRKRARQQTESWDALLEQHGEQVQQLFTTAQEDPQTSAEHAELAQRLLACLAPADRLLLTLREVEGLSYQGLANTLGCSVNAIKGRLRRARQRLQEHLRHFLDSSASKEQEQHR